MKTPIRYAGGKTRAFDFISSYIPFWPRPKRIISPFIGGGSLEVRWAHEMVMMYLIYWLIIGNINYQIQKDCMMY